MFKMEVYVNFKVECFSIFYIYFFVIERRIGDSGSFKGIFFVNLGLEGRSEGVFLLGI